MRHDGLLEWSREIGAAEAVRTQLVQTLVENVGGRTQGRRRAGEPCRREPGAVQRRQQV
jgi:hypothetical protein